MEVIRGSSGENYHHLEIEQWREGIYMEGPQRRMTRMTLR